MNKIKNQHPVLNNVMNNITSIFNSFDDKLGCLYDNRLSYTVYDNKKVEISFNGSETFSDFSYIEVFYCINNIIYNYKLTKYDNNDEQSTLYIGNIINNKCQNFIYNDETSPADLFNTELFISSSLSDIIPYSVMKEFYSSFFKFNNVSNFYVSISTNSEKLSTLLNVIDLLTKKL